MLDKGPLDTNHAFQGDYAFLSNFYPYAIQYRGRTFSSSEAAYQSMKALEEDVKDKFTRMKAYEAKKYWKKRQDQIRGDWKQISLDVMREVLLCKFSGEFMAMKLLSTGSLELVEYNYWGDTFFGVCKGVGENHLGKILMEIRRGLRVGESE